MRPRFAIYRAFLALALSTNLAAWLAPSFAAALPEAPNTFTYQGRLKESGTPASGPRCVRLEFWNAETGGIPQGVTSDQIVSAQNGLFKSTFTLPSSSLLQTNPLYVQVYVGATPCPATTALLPRELLTSSLYAIRATSAAYAHALQVESPSSPGLFVSSNLFVTSGNVGIGTTSPDEKLTLPYNQFIGWEYSAGNSSVAHKIGKTSDGAGPLEFVTTFNPGPTGRIFSFKGQGTPIDALSILDAGNVGVGTTAPSTRLHVSGGDLQVGDATASTFSAAGYLTLANLTTAPGSARGRLYFDSAAPGGALKVDLGSGFVVLSTGGAAGGGLSGSGTANRIPRFTAATILGDSALYESAGNIGIGTTSPSTLFQVGAGTLAVTTSGNVGIGTTGPTWKLDVRDPTSAMIQAKTTSGGSTVSLILDKSAAGDSASVLTRTGGANRWGLGMFGDELFRIIYDNTVNTRLLIDSAGNVGIGTVSPGARLDVKQDSGTGDLFRVGVGTLTVQSTGNVGIGTTGPGAKLEVAGQIKITGGTPAAGEVLTSDGAGLATWEPAAGGGGGWTDTGSVVQLVTAGDNVVVQSTLTVQGNAFSVGSSTFVVKEGNVGIGTTSPSSRLFVEDSQGAASTTPLFTLNNTAASGQNMLDFRDQGTTGGRIRLAGGGAFFIESQGASDLRFMTAGIVWMTLKTNGFLGVGDSLISPATRLDVAGAAQFGAGATKSTFTATGSLIMASGATITGGGVVVNPMTTPLNLNAVGPDIGTTNQEGVTISTHLFVSAGNVGIGTTSPTDLVTLQNGWIKFNTAVTGIKWQDGSTSTTAATGGGGGFSGTGTVDRIAKFTGPSAVGNSVIAESGGNVGIGTTNPRSVLAFRMGTGTAQAQVLGISTITVGDFGTPASTTETDLIVYTLAANSLSSNGQALRIKTWGTTGANTNAKTIRLVFAPVVGMAVNTNVPNPNGSSWEFEALVYRTSATQVYGTSRGSVGSTTESTRFFGAGTDTTLPITIKVTGQNGVATANDIVAKGLLVEYLNW